MQKLLEGVTTRLKAFVDQRDDLALVVRCRDEEAVVILKALEGIDDASTSEMVWVFSDDFRDAASYVSTIVEAFGARHAAVRLGMEREGMTPWPPLPAVVLDQARRPVERLRELMIFSRALLPAADGFVAAWALVPLTIEDHKGWTAVLTELVRHTFPLPWCHHLRLYLRGDPADPVFQAALQPMPRVAWYEPDLSQAAIQRALEEEAADPSLPLEHRLQNLFMSAGVDYAFQRYHDALRKHAVLLKYYAGTRNATMSALVLNAVGEIHFRLGDTEQAGQCFDLAFTPASQAPGPPIPVMLNIVLNLANLRLAQARWEEGEAYYDSAQQLATAQRDAGTKLGAIENLGQCQYMQGKVKEALTTWHAGAALAGELELMELRESMLRRLAAHYQQSGDASRHAEVERQLAVPPSAASAVVG